MSLLIETIRIMDGHIENIAWHNKRLNYSRFELFGLKENYDLEKHILIPEKFRNGEVKCRVSYREEIELIEFENYVGKPIESLKVVSEDNISYSFKFSDRSAINHLYSQRENRDDVLIIKNGNVTDSSYANLVFSDGKDFFTPSTPLLRGTKRARYINEGKVMEINIPKENIHQFKEVHLINAFLDLGRCVVKTDQIY